VIGYLSSLLAAHAPAADHLDFRRLLDRQVSAWAAVVLGLREAAKIILPPWGAA